MLRRDVALVCGLLCLMAPLFAACEAIDAMTDSTELAEIQRFTASPEAGPAALAVQFEWSVRNVFDELTRTEAPCSVYILPPGTDRPRPAHLGACVDGGFSHSFDEPGLYEAVLFVHTGRTLEEAQTIFDEHAQAGGDDGRQLAEWLENRAVQRSLLLEVTEPVVAEDAPDAEDAAVDASDTGEPFWELVFINQNPDGVPTEADILTENSSYAGSNKACRTSGNVIVYDHTVAYNGENLATVTFTYTFDEPPVSAEPGDAVTLTQGLTVSGYVQVGGGQYPGGRASLYSDVASPPGLSIASGNLNIEDAPTVDEGQVTLRFPPADRDAFTITAAVYDTQQPDIFCDAIYRYELRGE